MERNKHDHKATKKLKAWLFGIMLLLPFLFMIPTGLYYGLNQNAQLSERTEQQPVYYQSNELNSIDDLTVGNVYSWNDNFTNIGTVSTNQKYMNIFILSGQYANSSADLYLNRTGDIYLDISGTYSIISSITFDFKFNSALSYFNSMPLQVLNCMSITNNLYIKEYQPVTYTNDISTSIINAWNSTWQNPLFSWTNNTFITTTINNFTSGFGITAETYISNLITYIAILTAIYIIFDIVIELFTKLTHIIPRSD